MRHKKIRHIVESRIKKINDAWDEIIKHFDIEKIHDFRVEIKKMRAFMRLAATSFSGAAELKLPFHLKSMYQYAGNLRNLQLQQQWIFELITDDKIRQQSQYLKMLEVQQEEWKQKIKDISNPKALETDEKMIIATLPFKLGKTETKNYCRMKADELNKLIAVVDPSDDELHQMRKILKDVLYTLPYTDDSFFSFIDVDLQAKEKIEFLTDLLGEFQDACIYLELLHPEGENELNDPEEITLLQTIREQCILKKSDMKARVCEKLDQLRVTTQESTNIDLFLPK
jgi:CHAD domain-containing protein